MTASTTSQASWLKRLFFFIAYPFALFYYLVWTTAPVDPLPKKRKLSISFAGCAFLFPYYVGVMKHLIENYDLKDVTFIALSSSCYPLVIYLANGMNPEE